MAGPSSVSRKSLILAGLAVAALASLALALACGSLDTSLADLAGALWGGGPGIAQDVIVGLRLPRALAAFACGALLALAGVLLQVLLRNPLADPYVLGVSSGAALGALIAMAAGLAGIALQGMAASGALAAMAVVFALSWRAGDWRMGRLLLTGVVLASGLAALISLVLATAPAAQAKGMLFWLMGDLGDVTGAPWLWAVLGAVLAPALVMAAALDALALGPDKARALGVGVTAAQLALYIGAALATTAAVTVGGSIGFVGLVVPHALRLMGLAAHRWLVPGAALAGGSLLVLADTAARTVWSPQQLPVGVLTALIGVPVMLALLARTRG
jgi:iron complex transport system permease protein